MSQIKTIWVAHKHPTERIFQILSVCLIKSALAWGPTAALTHERPLVDMHQTTSFNSPSRGQFGLAVDKNPALGLMPYVLYQSIPGVPKLFPVRAT